jgi:hypothetical protein
MSWDRRGCECDAKVLDSTGTETRELTLALCKREDRCILDGSNERPNALALRCSAQGRADKTRGGGVGANVKQLELKIGDSSKVATTPTEGSKQT